MTLDPLHDEIARIALAVPGTRLALAGGAAMLAHRLVDRPTRDVDLFSPQQADLPAAADHLRAELTRRGHHVSEDRRTDTFIELTVVTADGRTVGVQLAVDARRREPVVFDIGAVLHPEERADKTLARFDRATARDLVDVTALADRYPFPRLLELAADVDCSPANRRWAGTITRLAVGTPIADAEAGPTHPAW